MTAEQLARRIDAAWLILAVLEAPSGNIGGSVAEPPICDTLVVPGDAAGHARSIDLASEPELLETWQAAERFGVPDDTVRKWCQRHRGIGEKTTGNRWLVYPDAIAERVAMMRARDNI